MTDIDLSCLPTGARGWAALIAWAAASDDRLERYFLELKSDVDLGAKHGRHKVVKFILGAANRDPAKAGKRFGGYAVMLLGVGAGSATGISPCEAQDLEREIRKFTGAEGPGWDYEQIPVDVDHSVIAIVVDPPTGRVWPCLADGEGMTNGDIYVRGDGRTEKATGAEIQAMLTRAGASSVASKLPEITVEILGEALAVRFDSGRLVTFIKEVAQDYLDDVDVPEPTSPFGAWAGHAPSERRSKVEFRGQVERWQAAALADPASGLNELAARMAVSIRLRVTNPVKTSLRDVRIDIELDSPTRALDWEEPYKKGERAVLFQDRPLAWGSDSFLSVLGSNFVSPFAARDNSGVVRITQSSPPRLSLSLDLLRAAEIYVSEEDEVVLVLFVEVEK